MIHLVFFLGALVTRVGDQQCRVGDLFVAIGYVLLNVACLFIGQDIAYATTLGGAAAGVGSLQIANAIFMVILIGRNSPLSFFLGIHVDRAIMWHRWLGRFTGLLILLHLWYIVSCNVMLVRRGLNLPFLFSVFTSPNGRWQGEQPLMSFRSSSR